MRKNIIVIWIKFTSSQWWLTVAPGKGGRHRGSALTASITYYPDISFYIVVWHHRG